MSSFEKLLSDFSSWHWWITVVLVGLGVNLLSAYLKEPLDRLLQQWSKRRAERSKTRSDQTYAAVRLLLGDSRLVTLRAAAEIRWRMQMIGFLVFAVAFMVAATQISAKPFAQGTLGQVAAATCAVGAFVCIALAFWAHRWASAVREMLFLVEASVETELENRDAAREGAH